MIYKRIFFVILAVVLVALLAGGLFVRQVARKALPDYNRSVYLEGLHDEVRIYRDQNAMPHIFATNEQDLYMAVGYVMAQDRLWQMDLLRRATTGRLSEIFGEEMVGADHLLRALRIPEKSEMVLAASGREQLLALQAFCSGVNQFIDAHQKTLPFEFTVLRYRPEYWEPVHSINLIGYMAWDLSGSWGPEVLLHKLQQSLDEERFRELIPDMELHNTFVYPSYAKGNDDNMFSLLDHNEVLRGFGLELFNGSNSWAVSGEKTVTGKPIFCNDMHLGFGSPGIWYPMHQVVEGKLNVRGVALPGQPLIVVGHNEQIAWGMTNLYVDDIDFYLETTHADHPDRYLLDGEWKEMEVRAERIAVGKSDTVIRENRFTHRGPIVTGFKRVTGSEVSMRWTGNEPSNEFRTIYLLNRAHDWDSFRDALSTMISVSQNVTYADVHGNIGQQTAGGVPVRRQGSGIFLFPGNSSESDWIGMLPFEELPFEYNPPSGFVSSANNRTTGDDYPHYIGHWFDTPNRIDRIRELLVAEDRIDTEYMKMMLSDAHSKLAERFTGTLTEVLQKVDGLSHNEEKALEALESWDFVYDTGSIAASVFDRFYIQFLRELLHGGMGEELFREFGSMLARNMFERTMRNRESVWIGINTPGIQSFEDLVLASFKESVRWLEDALGDNPRKWQWGELHHLTIGHPMASVNILNKVFGLSRGPYAVDGSFHTIANYAYSLQNPFAVVHGASMRHIFNLADWSDNHMVIPTGVSGIPASAYFMNQLPDFVDNSYFRQAWTRRDVRESTRYSAVLAPARR